jgi:glutamate-1-semialdehyde 2,1-aminomutase
MSDKDRYKKSMEFLARAEKTIPLGSQTFSKSRLQFPVPYAPMFLDRGKGGRVWDVDGNEYVDLMCGLLPISLGYCDPDVDAAIIKQVGKGISFSLATELESEVAEKMVNLIPCAEKVRFGKNGTDATSAAIRLARAFTGRDHVLVCGYHGWQDWYIGSTTRNKGVPGAVSALTHKVPFNDIDALEAIIAAHKNQIAALMIEPLSSVEPSQGYLEAVRDITRREGIVLIFDEVITGFRAHIGGAQALYNVMPDLAAFGKGMANGMPISAIVGRADIMDMMNEIFYSGTFGGEALSLAAASATIDKIKRENAIEKMWQRGADMAARAESAIAKNNLQQFISFCGIAPWKILTFTDHPSAKKESIKTRFMIEMLKNGVLISVSHNICLAHDERDAAHVENAYNAATARIAQDLKDGKLEERLEVPPIMPIFQVRG